MSATQHQALRKQANPVVDPHQIRTVMFLAFNSYSRDHLAAFLGVERKQLSRHLKRHPELAQAWRTGRGYRNLKLRHWQWQNPTFARLKRLGIKYLGQNPNPPVIGVEILPPDEYELYLETGEY